MKQVVFFTFTVGVVNLLHTTSNVNKGCQAIAFQEIMKDSTCLNKRKNRVTIFFFYLWTLKKRENK